MSTKHLLYIQLVAKPIHTGFPSPGPAQKNAFSRRRSKHIKFCDHVA